MSEGFQSLDEQLAHKGMNKPSSPNHEGISESGTHLLDTVRATRQRIGDGLNDDELTSLLRQNGLPNEAGFGFLNLSGGVVTLSVPEQDLANWYPEKGWILPEKEKIASAIAQKYDLLFGEPPDEASSFRFPGSDETNIHHHLELRNSREAIIVAHPEYLKVRIFGTKADGRYGRDAKVPLLLGPELLQDLSALYDA